MHIQINTMSVYVCKRIYRILKQPAQKQVSLSDLDMRFLFTLKTAYIFPFCDTIYQIKVTHNTNK